MNKIIKSCQHCTKRFPGCHSICGRYRAERAEYDRQKAEERKRKKVSADFRQFRIEGIERSTGKKTGQR